MWTRIALLSFGGPAGQIAVMHRVLVEEERWVGQARFLHALSFCTLLPGPEAQQLATYLGWLMHRNVGGLIAGGLFVLPGVVAILALSLAYVALGQVPAVSGLFFGLKCAVLAVVLQALLRLARRALRRGAAKGVAWGAFAALFLFDAPFPVIVLAAGLTGYLGARLGVSFDASGSDSGALSDFSDADSRLGAGTPTHARPDHGRTLATLVVFLLVWLLPVALLLLLLGPDNVFAVIAVFFSKLATVTFGGAYAVLAYVAQAAVEAYGWLRPGEMLDGLGMAETTPGPLIMVVQFVGFMAAYRMPGALDPYLAGTLGGLTATWVTFAPCFLWIFVGAPYVEVLREHRALSSALAAITAAIVGVILDLALWFGAHVLFARVTTWRPGLGIALDWPDPASLRVTALALSAAATLALLGFRTGVVPTLLLCALAGIGLDLVGPT